MEKKIESLVLKSGGHSSPEAGLCAMEAVAWLAGEPHSDAPECACPVLASYVRKLNDRMPDDARQRLKDYLPRLIGSRNPALEMERVKVLAWAAVAEFAPAALDAAGLPEHAKKLREVSQYDWDAAAYAADAAADAAARAAADAADAAAYAADAAADAARAAGTGNDPWAMALAALDRALNLK